MHTLDDAIVEYGATIPPAGMAQRNLPVRATTITRNDDAETRGLVALASTPDIDDAGNDRMYTVRLSSKSIGHISVEVAAQGDDELRYNRRCSRRLR